MDALKSFLVMLFGFSLAILISILVLMKGWGLEPQSWWWILGGGVCVRLIAEFISMVEKSKKNMEK